MIIFASAYDEATHANHAVAKHVCSQGDLFLGAEDATRDSLHGALRTNDGPLLAMCHGLDDSLRAQGGASSPAAMAVDDGMLAELRGRAVFAHACLTGKRLGRAASEHGSTWWGYDIPVNAPENDPLLLPIFVEVFSFIKSSFGAARRDGEIDQFFLELHERCEDALYRLYELEQEREFPVPLGAHQCLIQIQKDLLVWIPQSYEPRFAPHVRGNRRLRL
ncbi:MAG TPA: hypothetical protein VLS89_21110 [Candidatus Nanopelagicales bacterium]|nr:hypothetical protein [Candidatus Nanopelagicales bacterium]